MSTASIEEKKNVIREKDVVWEEKPSLNENTTEHIRYDKGTLLEIRSSPASQTRPIALNEEFLNVDGIWDPEAWHTSKASRTSSPMVDQKIPDGKKKEQMDDGIELAPHRRSFRQGCHVSMTNDGSDKAEKYNTRPMFEKKSRLTGRASGQRKNMENNFREHGDGNNANYGDFEKPKRERYTDKESRPNRFDKYADKENHQPNKENDSHLEKEKYESSRDQRKEREHDNHPNERKSKGNRSTRNNEKDHLNLKSRREVTEEILPEWMTDGPTSQLDTMEFTGFQDIEDEKKAYAKTKKKVRISPDVEVQTLKSARRSSTPMSQKSAPTTSKEDMKAEVIEDEKPLKESSLNKSPTNFDITEFFSEVNFYPPRLFHDDLVKGDGIRSRFTQYFQSKSRSNSHSSDGGGSGPLLPDEIFIGVQRKSPVVPVPYFTPIQPASPVPMVTPVTSAIVNFIQEQALENAKTNKEIKGRLNVEQLEFLEKSNPPIDCKDYLEQDDLNQSAFDLLVQSMKDAGQLPDKPAPVVTGLPDHLLPQPPRKSSPTFEKLKRTLSRSPSPAEFMKSVSTVASILASNPTIDTEIALKKNPIQLSHPSPVTAASPDIFQQEEFEHVNGINNTSISTPNIRSLPVPDRTPIGNHSLNTSFASSNTPQLQRLPTAFLPTSVLKKMHSEKQRESPSTVQQQPSSDKSPLVNGHNDSSFSDLLVNSVRSPKPSPRETHHESEHALSAFDNLSIAGQLNLSNIDTDDIPFHSAPPTPRHSLNNHNIVLPPHSNSAPNTPEHRFHNDPPTIHRVSIQPPGLGSLQNSPFSKSSQPLMVPSAFQAPVTVKQNKTNDFGVIGSGIPQKGARENEIHGTMESISQHGNLEGSERPRGFADPRLAPGNGVIRNTRNIHSPVNNTSPSLSNHSLRTQMQSTSLPQNQSQPSQQQQLLQAQRMAQIHQAQLHQQQKLQQIANQAKLMQQQKQSNLQGKQFTAPAGVRPLLPDPDTTSQQQQKRTGEQQIYQQQQRQQIQAYHQQQQQRQQQQQQQQQQQMSQQQQQQPRPPSSFANNGVFRGRHFQNPEVTRNSPPMPMPLHQPGLQAFQNLNRPQGIQNVNLAAQALVQQQLLNQAARARFIAQTQLLQQQPQVMHALMAQAALVRGQAQAQAAMMFNQKNLQAMAEQMGIRPPLPHLNNKHIPTPMINTQPNHPPAPACSVGNSQTSNVPSSSDGLSKWFGKDILNLLPQNNPPPTELSTGKVMSVEELERKQRSS